MKTDREAPLTIPVSANPNVASVRDEPYASDDQNPSGFAPMSSTLNHLTPAHADQLKSGLIDVMPGGVVYVLADGSISAANQEAMEFLGLTTDELTNRYISEFAPDTYREDGSALPIAEYPASRALATGEAQPGMVIGVDRPDGRRAWAIFKATPVCHADGSIEGAIVTFVDITERKRAEAAAERDRELLGRAQSMTKVGYFEWDMQTNRVTWSDAMFAIYGIHPDEFAGDVEATLSPIHPDDRAMVAERAEIALKSGVTMPTEWRIVHPDGAIRFVAGIAETVRDGSGTPRLVRGVIQDLTERKELEDRLHQMQRMDSVGQLTSGIAHDFNNLMQVILGNAAIGIRDNSASIELVEIEQAATRAVELTQQLLAFGRRQKFTPKIISTNGTVQKIQRMLTRTLRGGAKLQITLEASTAEISADKNQLEQVLLNLCLNARDAMTQGGTITIATRRIRGDAEFRKTRSWVRMERYVEISVSDTGCGMTSETQNRIFEPYFTTKPVGHGSGLGLAAVHGIVSQHEGMVEVESEVGVGSIFRVYLPEVAQGHASAAPADPIPTPLKPGPGANGEES